LSTKSTFKGVPPAAKIVVVLFGIGGAYAVVRTAMSLGTVDYGYFALMLFLAIVTAHTKVRLIGGSSLSLLTTVVLLTLMMLGTKAALLVGVCGVMVQCMIPARKFIPHHMVFNVGMISLIVLISGAGYGLVTDAFVGSMIASLLYYIGNSICVSLAVGLSSRKSMFRLWHDNFLYTAPSFFVAGLLAYFASWLAARFPATALMVIVPILYICYYSYRVYIKSLENEKKHASEMAELFNSTLSTLALAIDAKDKNTHGHIQRVQKYARAIAEAMRLSEQEVTAIGAAALLHDIGKLAIPEYILSKTGPLTAEEMRKMRLHPQLGADIISNIKFPYPVADSILAHHERFDGKGYPNGLRGKDIPLGARLLAVADYFDAYTSERAPSPETIEEAMDSVKAGSATLFDPDVVAVWSAIYKDTLEAIPAASQPNVYSNIQRATSEIKKLESFAETVSQFTTVEDMASALRSLVESSIPHSTVSLKPGAHDGIPVTVGDQVIATISVQHVKGNPTDDEIRLVTAAAEKIAGPLNKVLALENARREATVDKLTGLPNRRAFEELTERLPGKHFCLVLVDVNGFKAVNDTFGHQAGDSALIRIGAHLQAGFAGSALICRLGGDEFLVVSDESKIVLRRQIRNFRKLVVSDPHHEAYRKMRFGVSCGLANVPGDVGTIEEGMKLADARMYAVKVRFKKWAGVKEIAR
jgi:diguanylate cyclase (GGDEF)-like protein/putative nucleotidyltransferase with HDIG domain